MLGDLVAQVEVGQRVAVEDEHALLEHAFVGGQAQRAGGAERLVLDHVAEAHPAVLVAEDALDVVRPVAAREQDVVDAVAPQPVEHEGEERLPRERDDRLREREGERTEARALTAGEHERLHGRAAYLPTPS